MPSTYYEQGQRDAQNGQFNQLFYHTYHDYKRGYDEGLREPPRRKLSLLLPGLVLVLVLGGGLGWLARDRGVLSAARQPTIIVVTATPVTPTPTFPFLIATPQPTATPTTVTGLQIGLGVVVDTQGDALRVRSKPTTTSDRIGSLTNQAAVTIVGGPRQADGYTWWEVQSPTLTGWVVGEFLKPGP